MTLDYCYSSAVGPVETRNQDLMCPWIHCQLCPMMNEMVRLMVFRTSVRGPVSTFVISVFCGVPLSFGYYDGDKLIYAARIRNGFTPVVRAQLMKKFRGLETKECPFANLPEKKSGRWGAGLTAAKMKDCRWLKPVLVGQFEFLEWTGDHHLRHSKFVALREDKSARDVKRE